MKYLLMSVAILGLLTWWLVNWANRQGDDFGAALPPVAAGVAFVFLALIYLVLALYRHQLF